MNRLTTNKQFSITVLFCLCLMALAMIPAKSHAALSKTIEIAIPDIKRIFFPNPADKEPYPIPFGKTVELKADAALLEGLTLTWSTETVTEGVKAELSNQTGLTCTFTPSEKSASGYIAVKAAFKEHPSICKTVKIKVGCDCAHSGEGMCAMPDKEDIILSSVNAHLSLGKALSGFSAGELAILAKTATKDLATPKALQFSSMAGEEQVEALYGSETLRQIVAPQTFVDVVAISNFGYEIRFYDPSARGAKTDGFYVVDSSVVPKSVWRIENPDASETVFNRLRLTKIKDGKSIAYEYIWDAAQGTWFLSRGNGLSVESRSETTNASGDRVVTHTVKDDQNKLSSATQTTYHQYPWGEEVIKTVNDPAGAALNTITDYYQGTGNSKIDGKIKRVTNPDGSWTRYEYDDKGRRLKEIHPWLNSPIIVAEGAARVIYNDYTPVDPEEIYQSTVQNINMARYADSPRALTETILGQTVSKTFYAYLINDVNEHIEITERCATPSAAYGDPGNQRTARTHYAADSHSTHAGKIRTVVFPDGRMDSYTYESGTYSPNADPASPGEFISGSGQDQRTIIVHGTVDHPSGIIGKITREISITGATGQSLQEERYIYTDSGYILVSWTKHENDDYGRPTATYASDGTATAAAWGCCGKESETDRNGITRSYIYDDLKRVAFMTKHGIGAQPDITTQYTYDGSGRRFSETVTAGNITQTTSSIYDSAGRLDYSFDMAGLQTDYAYEPSGLMTIVTRPGGATEITSKFLDGRTQSITGSGVIPRFYEYGVNPDGTQFTILYTGSPGSPMWEKTFTDFLGRTIRMEKPGYTGIEATESVYDQQGRLAKTITTGQADTLYEYDELGNQVKSGLDINASGVLENTSKDRINETETTFIQVSDAWWQQTSQRVFAVDDSGLATNVATQRTRLTGLGAGLTAEIVSVDIHDNWTVARTFLDAGTQTETRTVDYPDSDINAVTMTVGGLLSSSTGKTGLTTNYGYDALGRQTSITDPRTGISSTHYNDKGQVDYIEDPLHNRTSLAYDPTTGRKLSETNALNLVTRFTYNDRGQVTHTWGDSVYPVKYVFDNYGRMGEMHTYRNGTGWDTETWPLGQEGPADITKWRYHEPSGLLEEKEDAAGKITSYTYTFAAKLQTRTWARQENGNPIVTTYGYDPNTGELLSIDYSDTTPDISFTYDRLGRQHTVTDAAGSRTFAYNKLQLSSETMLGLINKTVTRTYAATGVVGRPTGFNTGSDYSITYGFDPTGRFNTLTWNVSGNTQTGTYTYEPQSDLLKTLQVGGYQTTNTYEPHRNLRTQIKNELGGTLVSQYDYHYDALGRRESVQNSGIAFTVAAFNKFGYDDRNQVTESSRYTGTTIDDLTNPVPAEYRGYEYDPIGNRKMTTKANATDTYTANPLNQYTQVAGDDSQTLGYDFDGNLTDTVVNGIGRKLTYNAENRLIAVEPQSPIDGNTKVEFVYDYMGRRVKKFVYAFSSDSWLLTSEYLFLYDSWNLIEETKLSGTTETTRYFVWGLDLSQSLQGAGGIGGLIEVVDGSSRYEYFYDGNGNVGQLVNAASSRIAAQYEYDPYGNPTNAVGDYASTNPFKFSTKYFDTETELYYYGYRYYSAELGRWINRDPIEEKGGSNLYVAFLNNPIDGIDNLGLFKTEYHEEIIKKAFANEIEEIYLTYLLGQDALVDITRQLNGEYHYDNNDIQAGNQLIENAFKKIEELNDMKLSIADKRIENLIKCTLNLDHFAAITHVSADFFSHTNAVERMIDPEVASKTKLSSGYFSISNHIVKNFLLSYPEDISYWVYVHSAFYEGIYSKLKFTHHQLEKDSPTSLEGRIIAGGASLFNLAESEAVKSLKLGLEEFKKRAPCIWASIKKN